MKPLVCAIGVSRKDVDLAITWLNWVYLLDNMTPFGGRIEMCYTRSTRAVDLREMEATVRGLSIRFTALPDEHENGYPGSASHLFLRTMEHCEREHPGHPVLWVEADAIPTRPGWFQEIEAEYQSCPTPFMGHLEPKINPPHMAGVGVYPPNWRELSPRLANVMQAPDLPKQWGRGKGQAFDTYAGPEIMPQATQAKTIQQIWNCPPLTDNNQHLLKPETALFHHCKTGSLIDLLSRTKFHEWTSKAVA